MSIPTNLVEGSARRTQRDYVHFVNVALGSASELLYLIQLSQRLDVASPDTIQECETCALRVVKMLQKLLSALTAPP